MSKRLPASERNPNRRGAFCLRLATGRVVRFKDADLRGNASYEMSTRRFPTMEAMATALRSQPNGYSTFRDDTDSRDFS